VPEAGLPCSTCQERCGIPGRFTVEIPSNSRTSAGEASLVLELVTDTHYSCMNSGASRELSLSDFGSLMEAQKHESAQCTCDDVTTVITAHLAHEPTKRGDKGATHPRGTAHHQTQDTETCTFNKSQATAAIKHAASLLLLVIFIQVFLEGRKPLVAQLHRAELKPCDSTHHSVLQSDGSSSENSTGKVECL
jgi:hypothetical protein